MIDISGGLRNNCLSISRNLGENLRGGQRQPLGTVRAGDRPR